MRKSLAILAIIPMLLATGCGNSAKNDTATAQEQSIIEVPDFDGKIETAQDGVRTYTCPVYAISEQGDWKIDTDLKTAENVYFVSFANKETDQGDVTVTAYTAKNRNSIEKECEQIKELCKSYNHGEQNDVTYMGYDAAKLTFENYQTGTDHQRVEYIVFDTGEALFQIALFYNGDPSMYQKYENYSGVLLKKLNIFTDNTEVK